MLLIFILITCSETLLWISNILKAFLPILFRHGSNVPLLHSQPLSSLAASAQTSSLTKWVKKNNQFLLISSCVLPLLCFSQCSIDPLSCHGSWAVGILFSCYIQRFNPSLCIITIFGSQNNFKPFVPIHMYTMLCRGLSIYQCVYSVCECLETQMCVTGNLSHTRYL